MDCSMPGFPVNHQLPSLLRFMFIESVMTFNHLILCHPLLLLSSIFPSIRVFSDELVLLQSLGVSALYVCSVQSQKGMPLDRTNISAVNSNKLKYKVLVLSYFICVWLCHTMDYSPAGYSGVGCHALLQGIFLTQESNLCLLHLLH